MTDPIADMLTRIRNAMMVKKREVFLPMSKTKHEIAKILDKEGYIQKVELIDSVDFFSNTIKGENFKPKSLKIVLKYKKSGKSVISSLKRISKPGLRIYSNKNELPIVLNGFGIAIISTPKGMMTNIEAKKQKIGGEVICEVY